MQIVLLLVTHQVEGFRMEMIIPFLNSVEKKCQVYSKFFDTAEALGKTEELLPFNNCSTTAYIGVMS